MEYWNNGVMQHFCCEGHPCPELPCGCTSLIGSVLPDVVGAGGSTSQQCRKFQSFPFGAARPIPKYVKPFSVTICGS